MQAVQELQEVRPYEILVGILRAKSIDAIETERNPGVEISSKVEVEVLR